MRRASSSFRGRRSGVDAGRRGRRRASVPRAEPVARAPRARVCSTSRSLRRARSREHRRCSVARVRLAIACASACLDWLAPMSHAISSPAPSSSAAELDALLDRAAGAEGGAAVLARARRPQRRADLPEALDAHARVLRGRHPRARRPRGRAARRGAAALARRGAARHRARALAPRRRDRGADRARRDARGARRAQHRPGDQHAHRAAPPLPGARRPADAARGLRLARRPARRLRRRRQQRRALARAARHARRAWTSRSPRRRATRSRTSLGARRPARAARSRSTRDPREAVAGRGRGLHRRVGEHGR